MSPRPLRSVLYLPASNARAVAKAREVPADAVVLDLEDAVAPDAKVAARAAAVAAVAEGGFGRRTLVIRINAPDTPWGAADARAAAATACDAILVPKVRSPADIDTLAALAPGRRLWAMIETPAAVLAAPEIARHPALDALVLGTNDLARELGARHRPDRAPLMAALSLCLLAARAAGRVCLDSVYNAFRDEDGLRAECVQARDLGMDGKTLIHPAQIAVANAVFAPGADEIALAQRQIAAYDAALGRGSAVAVLDGAIVENLHVEVARALLARARAIEDLERP